MCKCDFFLCKTFTITATMSPCIMSLKVTGNHVVYYRSAWSLRVIMSSSLALSCLPPVKKQKCAFLFHSTYNNRVLDSVFVIHRIIKVSVRIIMTTHTSTFWITQKPHPIIVYNPPQHFRHLWCSSDDYKTFLLEFYSTISLLQIVVLSAVNNSNKIKELKIIFFLAFRSCGNHRDGWLCYSTRSYAP